MRNELKDTIDEEDEVSPKHQEHNKVNTDVVGKLDTDDDGSNSTVDDKNETS